jgi:hypothetical protein
MRLAQDHPFRELTPPTTRLPQVGVVAPATGVTCRVGSQDGQDPIEAICCNEDHVLLGEEGVPVSPVGFVQVGAVKSRVAKNDSAS